MLNIYYGREDTDREKFIFDHIKGRTLLLVPDQFSLQAEKDAFFYLKKESLMDLRVVDFSTLGHKVVNETGGRKPQLIDKYGRHMLLTKVLRETEDDLHIYKGLNWKNSFIELVNSFISEMKRYEVTPDDLAGALDRLDEGAYLRYKLQDIHKIYTAYQELIEGKYLDSEDYITFYGNKILEAQMVAEADVWVYGFDTFTSKNLLVLERILKTARSLNIVMTYEEENEIFELTGYVMSQLKAMADQLNEEVYMDCIDQDAKGSASGAPEITLISASDMYAEAERAAAYILRLIKEEGYRFGDIVVVCNDTEQRGGILQRVFARWGIPVFMDRKRKVLHHPAVGFVLALMEIIAKGYQDEAVMRLIKSGLMGFSHQDTEYLENYVKTFRIRGTKWREDFAREGDRFDAEDLNRLNGLRKAIVELIECAKESAGTRNTAEEKVRGLYTFLEKDFDIKSRLEEMMARQEELGLSESAAETAQSWNSICHIFQQIVETVGEEKLSGEELMKLTAAGLEEMEIGLVPVTSDCVIVGTLQRTRLSRIKAVLAVGANDGVLPLQRTDEGLLSDRELETLESMELEISKKEEIVRQEEQIALYRMLHLPQEKLYVSCCGVDEKGEELQPSEVFTQLRSYVERTGRGCVLGDLGHDGDVFEMLESEKGSLSYMADAFRLYQDGGDVDDTWLQVMNWFEENDASGFSQVKRGMLFDNRLERLGDKFADALYGSENSLEVSATRLERYSGCPFAHFVMYGLKAEEPRVFEMGAREIGDIYHHCLMRLSQRLTPDADSGIAVDDPASGWMTVTREECRNEIQRILEEDGANFREGMLSMGNAEIYRTERILEICSGIAWSMVQQVRKGHIKEMYFEYPFGRGKALPPVKVDLGERAVYIRGVIDRLDVIRAESVEDAADSGESGAEDAAGRTEFGAADGRAECDAATGMHDRNAAPETPGRDAIRIIDYKTGGNTIDLDHFRSGYKLQLMVYLKAAMQGDFKDPVGEGITEDACSPGQSGGVRFASPEPAGVFYFKIRDLDTDADNKTVGSGREDLDARMAETYKLEGILLNDDALIEAMDMEMETASEVLPVKRNKAGELTTSAGGHLLSREEFDELHRQVNAQVERICSEICSGSIDIAPKRERKRDIDGKLRTACRYCGYKSICMFDTGLEGCRYQQV